MPATTSGACVLAVLVAILTSCIAITVQGGGRALNPALPTIVVAGAAGKVGSRLVRRLRRSGAVNTVALVRSRGRVESSLEGGPLLVVEADYGDADAVAAALGRVGVLLGTGSGGVGSGSSSSLSPPLIRLFLSCGNVPDQARLELNVVTAAKEIGADFCVKLGTATAVMEADGASDYAAEHMIVEDELMNKNGKAGIAHCVLRPNMFMQVLTAGGFLGLSVKSTDPAAEGHDVAEHPLPDKSIISMIDCEDVAACAEAILVGDDPLGQHDGKVYELTGPEGVHIFDRLSAALSKGRERPVKAIPVQLEDALESHGIPTVLAPKLRPFLEVLSHYGKVTNGVKELIGRDPRSIDDFLGDRSNSGR